jgi:peptide/nickel transport system substrate-binding protein
VFDQDGPCTYTYDRAAKTVTLKLRPGIKWHDGEPVTLDDLVFAYEIICHPDYTGPRYDETMQNVVGAVEFHAGTASKISGLNLSADKMTLTITFKDFRPTILVGGFWIGAAPRHYLGSIPVKDMATSDRIRTRPIGFGPFKVKTIVPGESVEFVRNDDYWRGRPKLDGVSYKVVGVDMAGTALENGEIDVDLEFSTAHYADYKNPSNFKYIGQLETSFNYTAFDLGDYEMTKETNVGDPNKKMANLNLRRAIGYAANNQAVCDDLYNGLRMVATTAITPRHSSYQNKDLKGYYYDPEQAKQLLDEAGYKDVDGDGYREDPKGQPLTIYWAMMEGYPADIISQYKIQNWKDVGLRVELYNGRLMDFNVFYDSVEYDVAGIDMFDGAWQTGFDPDPTNLWGDNAWNFPHINIPELVAAMADCTSEQAWDDDFRADAYKKWQQLFFEQAPAIPTMWRTTLSAVNNRVKNYDMSSPDIDMKLHLIELTAQEPFKK